MTTFDSDAFVSTCVEARTDADPLAALRDVVARAVGDPASLDAAFPVPVDPADDGILYRSPTLLVVQGLFPGGFSTGIHDHTVAAVVGVWSGYEDNVLYRRTADGLEATDRRRVEAGEVLVLAEDAIHEVLAPATTWTSALHVYLGDITTRERSFWTAVDAPEVPLAGDEMEAHWLEAATAGGLVRSD